MMCPNCNSWVASESAYCTYCGGSVRNRSSKLSFFWWMEVVILFGLVIVFYLISSVKPEAGSRVSARTSAHR
jgi:hypothetical protein